MATTTTNNVQNISLSSIDDTIKTYQIRDMGINEQQVEALVFSDMKTWQPIIVKQLADSRYAIVSGFHRVQAAKERIAQDAINRYKTDDERRNAITHGLQHGTIAATVIPENLDENETRLLAYRYNSEHGLPLTIAEKKKYAVLIYLQNTDMAHYKIAQIVHISDKTVTSAIDEYKAEMAHDELSDDATDDEEKQDEDIVTIDFDKKFKSFATQLRKFYNEVISEINKDDDVTSYFVKYMVKPASNDGETPFDGDLEVLRTLSTTLTKAYKRLTPKSEIVPVKATKDKKTKEEQ